jgi:hypothetical protein
MRKQRSPIYRPSKVQGQSDLERSKETVRKAGEKEKMADTFLGRKTQEPLHQSDPPLFMGRDILRQHLAQAERYVSMGRARINRQESLIAELDRDGHDTGTAWALLDSLRVAQVAREQNLDRILRDFAKA